MCSHRTMTTNSNTISKRRRSYQAATSAAAATTTTHIHLQSSCCYNDSSTSVVVSTFQSRKNPLAMLMEQSSSRHRRTLRAVPLRSSIIRIVHIGLFLIVYYVMVEGDLIAATSMDQSFSSQTQQSHHHQYNNNEALRIRNQLRSRQQAMQLSDIHVSSTLDNRRRRRNSKQEVTESLRRSDSLLTRPLNHTNSIQNEIRELNNTNSSLSMSSRRHRTLQEVVVGPPSPPSGPQTVLAIRIESSDSMPAAVATEINIALFGTSPQLQGGISLNEQMQACSRGTVSLTPLEQSALGASVTMDAPGVWTITVPIVAAQSTHSDVVNAAMTRTQELTGIVDIRTVANHVMFILPAVVTDKGDFLASAEVGSSQSIFLDTWSLSLSGLMHEFGHNLGLLHSATWEDPYGDITGYMGRSVAYEYTAINEQPRQCYNAQNLWQLSWYEKSVSGMALRTEINVSDPTQRAVLIQITAFVDSEKVSNDLNDQFDEVVLVKVNDNVYMLYNRAKSYNDGTRMLPDQLVVVYDDSAGTQQRYNSAGDKIVNPSPDQVQHGTILLAGLDTGDVDMYTGYNIKVQVCGIIKDNVQDKDSMIVSVGNINQDSACSEQYQNEPQQDAPPQAEAFQATLVPVAPLVTTASPTIVQIVPTVPPTASPVTLYPIVSTSPPTTLYPTTISPVTEKPIPATKRVPRRTPKPSREDVSSLSPTTDEYLKNRENEPPIHDWSIYDKTNDNPRPTKGPVYYSSGGGPLEDGGEHDGFVTSANSKASNSDNFLGLTHFGVIGIIVALTVVVLLVMLSLRRRGQKRKKLCEFTSSILYSDINNQNHQDDDHDEDHPPNRYDQFIMENSDNSNGTIGRFRLPDQPILSASSSEGLRGKKSRRKYDTGSLSPSTNGNGNLLIVDDVIVGSITGFDNEDDDHECSTNEQTPIVNNTERNNVSRDDSSTTEGKKTNKSDSTKSAEYSMTPQPGSKEPSPTSSHRNTSATGTGSMAKAAFSKLFGDDVRRQNSMSNVNSPAAMYTTPCTSIGTTPPSSDLDQASSHSRSSLAGTIKSTFVGEGLKRNMTTASIDSPTSTSPVVHTKTRSAQKAKSVGNLLAFSSSSTTSIDEKQPIVEPKSPYVPIKPPPILQQSDDEVNTSGTESNQPKQRLILPDKKKRSLRSEKNISTDILDSAVERNNSLDNENSKDSSDIPAVTYQMSQSIPLYFQSRHQRLGGAVPAKSGKKVVLDGVNSERLRRESLLHQQRNSGASGGGGSSVGGGISGETDSQVSGLRGEDYLLTDLEDDDTQDNSLVYSLATFESSPTYRDGGGFLMNPMLVHQRRQYASGSSMVDETPLNSAAARNDYIQHSKQSKQPQLNPMILPANSSSERSDAGASSVLSSSLIQPFQNWFQAAPTAWTQSLTLPTPLDSWMKDEKNTTTDTALTSSTAQSRRQNNSTTTLTAYTQSPNKMIEKDADPGKGKSLNNHAKTKRTNSKGTTYYYGGNDVLVQHHQHKSRTTSGKNQRRGDRSSRNLHVVSTQHDLVNGSIEILPEGWNEI